MDDATVRGRLLNEFDLEVGAGLGELAGKQWRIGLMGASSSDVNINRCLRAFEAVLG
jgi:alanine-glyoxylate transaminase/serine-glyoxylate transaminase/serine-pyruvate transaminase